MENAFDFIKAGDAGKASEFLWGSIAEAVKAVAASKGIMVYSHAKLKQYAHELARELQDRSISDAFDRANSLHSNFYESTLELKDVYLVGEDVRATVGKLLELTARED